MKELCKLYGLFFKIGIMTFGGGYAMLPMLERELVIRRKYVTMDEILNYYAVGQCTPGIIAVNTATFIGFKRKKIPGGIFATLGMISPSLLIISLLATVLQKLAGNAVVESAFAGVSVAVCALLVQAVIKLGKAGIKDLFTAVCFVTAFALAFFVKLSPILVILCAAIAGVIYKAIAEKRLQDKQNP